MASPPNSARELTPASNFLRVGHKISLYAETLNGYVSIDSGSENIATVLSLVEENQFPPNFESCVFSVQLADHDETIGPDGKVYPKAITFGSYVRLLHITSSKFLHLKKSSASTHEPDCVQVYIDKKSSKTCWWKVMPRYKVRAEGEKVRMGDEIVLISATTYQNLHVSAAPLVEGQSKHEVNVSAARTGFTIFAFDTSFGSNSINAGESITLFHKEAEGYLSADALGQNLNPISDPVDVFLHIRRASGNKLAEHSSNSIWSIEFQHPTIGGAVSWGRQCRLKHNARSQYLTVVDSKFSTTNNPNDESTLFTFQPMDETKDQMVNESAVRIQHTKTGKWLHAMGEPVASPQDTAAVSADPEAPAIDSDDESAVPRDLRPQHMQTIVGNLDTKDFQTIGVASKSFYEDVFTVMRVADKELEKMAEVFLNVKILYDFFELVKQCGAQKVPIPKSKIQVVIDTLESFICFCTDSDTADSADAMAREGIPIRENQMLLFEQKVHDLAVAILMEPFRYMDINDLLTNAKEHKELHALCTRAYRLLKQMVKGAPDLATAISTDAHFTFFQSQLGYSFRTADTINEILKFNKPLLLSITEPQIAGFVELLDKGRKARYMNFLCSLCLQEEQKAVIRNQNIILKKLEQMKPEIIIPTLIKNGVLCIVPDGEPLPLFQLAESVARKKAEQDSDKSDKELYGYYERQITLFANLSMGRNESSINFVKKRIPYDVAFAALTDDTLPSNIRVAFCSLIRCVYIDNAPFERVSGVNLTRVWSDIGLGDKSIQSKAAMEENKAAQIETEIAKFKMLKEFIKTRLQRNTQMIASDTDENSLLLGILRLVRDMFSLAMYPPTDTEYFLPLIKGLPDILDGTSDQYQRAVVVEADETAPQAATVSKAQVWNRFACTEQNMIVMACKLEITKLMMYFFDQQQDHFITAVLSEYKKQTERGKLPTIDLQELMDKSKNGPSGSSSDTKSNDGQFLRNKIYPLSDDKSDDGEQESGSMFFDEEKFLHVALDVTQYEWNVLSTAAYTLLVRHFSRKKELATYLGRVQLLLSQQSVENFARAFSILRQLKKILQEGVPESDQARAVVLLEQLNAMFDQKDEQDEGHVYEVQSVMRNLEAHEIMTSFTSIPFTNQPHEDGLRKVLIAVFTFIKLFVKDNEENQELMLSHVEKFMTLMGVGLRAAETLEAVYENNVKACEVVPEKVIKHFVSTIASRGRVPRYLRFLRKLVLTSSGPIPRNQMLVTKHMLEKASFTMLLKTDSTREYLDHLFDSNMLDDPENELHYHIELVMLLSECCKGQNTTCMTQCQPLIPMRTIQETMANQSLDYAIRFAYVLFLKEVFASHDAEQAADSLPLNSFNKPIKHAVRDLEAFTRTMTALEKTPESVEAFFPPQTPRYDYKRVLTVSQAKFVIEGVIPFLHTYYRQLSDRNVKVEVTQANCAFDLGRHVCTIVKSNAITKVIPENKLAKLANLLAVLQKDTLKAVIATCPSQTNPIPSGQPGAGKMPRSLDEEITEILTEGQDSNPLQVVVDKQSPGTTPGLLNAKDLRDKFNAFAHDLISAIENPENKKLSSRPDELRKLAAKLKLELDPEYVSNMQMNQMKPTEYTLRMINNLKEDTNISDKLKMELFRILRKIITTSSMEEEPTRRTVSKRLCDLGIVECLMKCFETKNEEFLSEIIRCLNALLDEGCCAFVQEKMMEFFQCHRDETFFFSVSVRLQRFNDYFKESALLPKGSKKKDKKKDGKKKEEGLFGLGDLGLNNFANGLANVNINPLNNPLFNKDAKSQVKSAAPTSSGALTHKQKALNDKFALARGVMRCLQLMCEGHNLAMQDYLREQQDNIHSFDLVRECAKMLEPLVACLSPHTFKILSQLVDTLTEFCQGPCMRNQLMLVRTDTNICPAVNQILKLNQIEGVPEEDLEGLKEKSVVLLLSALEGGKNPSIPKVLINSLDHNLMVETLTSRVEVETEASFQLSFNIFVLYKMLGDSDPKWWRESQVGNQIRALENYDDLEKRVGRVEILRDDKLERVYFCIPEQDKLLPEDTKQSVLWELDRGSPASRISDFFDRIDELMYEVMYRAKINRHQFILWFLSTAYYWHWVALLNAFIINILLCYQMKSSASVDSETGDAASGPQQTIPDPPTLGDSMYETHLQGLSIFQLFLSVIIFAEFLVARAPIIAHKRMEDLSGADENSGFFLKFYHHVLVPAKVLGTTGEFLYPLLHFYASIAGITVSPFFFVIHLLALIQKSALLKSVIKSVTMNGKSLILTSLLGVIIIYIYTIFGFLFFRPAMKNGDGPAECNGLFQCFIFTLNNGLRAGGGIADVIEALTWGLDWTWGRVLFDISFFAIINVIFLNIIFGIIIDTFAELRDTKQSVEADMNTKCTVCGIDSDTFDRYGNGFIRHVHEDHNMWHYFFFVHYLHLKPVESYTGQESFVHNMISGTPRDLSWFPMGKAMCIDNVGAEDDEMAEVKSQIAALDKSVAKILNHVTTSPSESSSESPDIAKLAARISGLEKLLTGLDKKLDMISKKID